MILYYNEPKTILFKESQLFDLLCGKEKNARKIHLTESQMRMLSENEENEDLWFHGGKVGYNPNRQKNMDDRIFKDNSKELNVKKVLLPKSGIMSYNLYDIHSMRVNKALKHGVDMTGNPIEMDSIDDGTQYSNTLDWFLQRSVIYMRYIIGKQAVDYITYPQSSSDFNEKMANKLLSMYPNSEGIKIIPQMLLKNVRGIEVNVPMAKSVGLTDEEIETLERRVAKWHSDEDIRDIRRKVDALKDEIANMLSKTEHRRGRKPTAQIASKEEIINSYQNDIKLLRKGHVGKDSTLGQDGRTKDWQIKTIDDRLRRSIDNIFTINPKYAMMAHKFKGKSIVVFDDNLSSGATMDEICVALLKLGVKNIIPITLGVIPTTIYGNKH